MARASRNKTIVLSESERQSLLQSVLHLTEPVSDIQAILNHTINGYSETVLRLLPDGFADLIIADPPYNIDKKFNAETFKAVSVEEYERYLDGWVAPLCQKLKDNGSIYICCDWRSSSAVERVLGKYATIINRITWQREKGRGAMSNWKNAMEDIWFAVRNPKNYYFNLDAVKLKRKVIAPYTTNGTPRDWTLENGEKYRLTCPSNFWDDITVPYWSMPENTEHPTQKPEKLFAKLILASSPEGGIVLDPFLGSGTTSVTATKLGRNYVGIEADIEYCAVAEERLRRAKVDKSIQGYKDGVFWERNSLAAQKK